MQELKRICSRLYDVCAGWMVQNYIICIRQFPIPTLLGLCNFSHRNTRPTYMLSIEPLVDVANRISSAKLNAMHAKSSYSFNSMHFSVIFPFLIKIKIQFISFVQN